jgi:DNA polymerase-3 subunit gamma/tau
LDGRVLRNGRLQTPSDPEGSSGSIIVRVMQGCLAVLYYFTRGYGNSFRFESSDGFRVRLSQYEVAMSYLVLARKWRPNTFAEVIGQEGVVRTLQNAISLNRVHHAYLFCGPRGVGKTTVARILAKALNCLKGPTPTPDNDCSICIEIVRGSSPDVLEIDGASNTSVDDVRTLRENSQYLPARSRYKIYIIDEVHMLSTSAFNALLKTLEEPPAHVKFIFATTEPHKIPITVLSRCQRFDFKRIPSQVIYQHLQHILQQEGVSIDDEGLLLIAREASGSIRDALSLTDQVLAFGGQRITTADVRQALGLPLGALFGQVTQAVLERRPDDLMHLIEQLFDEGHDIKRFLEGLLWHVHHIILIRSLSNAKGLLSELLPEEYEQLVQQATAADLLHWHQIFDVLSKASEDLGRHPYPRLALETALLRLLAIEPMVGVDEVLARIENLSGRIGTGSPAAESAAVVRPVVQRNTPTDPNSRQQTGRGQTNRAPAAAPPARTSPSVRDTQVVAPSSASPASPVAHQHSAPEAISEAATFGEETPPDTWKALVQFVSQRRPALGSILQHAHAREVSKERVRIALEQKSFFADQLKETHNFNALRNFCSEFFSTEVALLVEEAPDEGQPSLAAEREVTDSQRAASIQQEALAHPLVQEVVRIFGAAVDQVLPGGRRES